MPNPKLTLSDLALHIGRHNAGDEGASAYLAELGLDLRPKDTSLNNGLPVEKGELFKPEKEEIPHDTQLSFNKAHFDFPIFTATNKTTKQRQPGARLLEGEAYSSEQEGQPIKQLAKAPIEPINSVLQRLQHYLAKQQPGARVAIDQLTQKVSRLEVLDSIPVQQRKSIPERLWLYIDRSFHNYGFDTDAFELADEIARHWPSCQLKVLVFPFGAGSEWGWLGQELNSNKPPLPPVGTSTLIATGLSTGSWISWRPEVTRLQKQGFDPVMLTQLAPNAKLKSQLSCHFVTWGSQKNVSGITLAQLNAMLFSTRIISGAMLRHIVQALSLPTGFETLFWQQRHIHYDFGSDTGRFGAIHEDFKRSLFQQLKAIDTAILEKVSAIIQLNLNSFSQSALHEHIVSLNLMQPRFKPGTLPQSIEFLCGMGLGLESKSEISRGLALFLAGTMAKASGCLQQADSRLQQTFARASHYLVRNNLASKVSGELLEKTLQLEKERGNNAELYLIGQRQTQLFIEMHQPQGNGAKAKKQTGAVVATLRASKDFPMLLSEGKGELKTGAAEQPALATMVKRHFPQDLPKDFILQSQFEALSITQRQASDFWWAGRLTVNSQGVIAETKHIKVIWLSQPGAPLENAKFGVKNGGYDRDSGAYICLTEDAAGWLFKNRPMLDDDGIYVTWQVGSESFNMRYIPPGSFLMGSPEDELQREKDELQHPVTLTDGFWLGEATVSQQLWQAVMGNNPSHFKADGNEQLPVESVSREDCQQFCQQLSELCNVKFTLPTEAQWEYACRAGTTTPFNTGEQLSFEQANYDVKYPYEGREKLGLQQEEKYCGKSVDVHQFPPNRWGLKQMHGNVWEWCLDDIRDYASQPVENPVGKLEDTAGAALRGGSWIGIGRNCRSAYRNRGGRDLRSDVIGLRVAQVSQDASKKK